MRLLGGILRPSRNQVTWGRGKLAMRGARMTAASPWETLWRFSPSSKLPMSAEGRAHAGVRGQASGRDCQAPGVGGWDPEVGISKESSDRARVENYCLGSSLWF